MQQNPVGDNLQVYASLSTLKVEPPQNEMTKGVVPLDTLPAGWWNWLWNAVTKAQNDARYSLDTIYQEINAVLAHAGITPNPEQFDQLKQAIIKLRTQIATAVDVGSVLSTETGTNGGVKVATDGKMTVNGFGDLQQLQTLMKDTLVEAINEIFNTVTTLDGELTAAEGRLDTAEGRLDTAEGRLDTAEGQIAALDGELTTAEGRLDTAESNIGTMTNLQTADKSSLVSAINELKTASGGGAAALEGRVDAIESNIGTLSSLDTTNKTNLVSAINEADDTANAALSKANTADAEIGTLSSLDTTNKTNLVSAINELNDTKANKSNVRYTIGKRFVGTRNGRYVKIGSIAVSTGNVVYVSLDITLFSSSKYSSFPVGMIELGMSSGVGAGGFNINGFSTIPISDSTSTLYPRIIVEKTSDYYILYIDSTYNYLALNVSRNTQIGFIEGNFEEVDQLTGTIVYNSVTDDDIVYLESITEAIEQISPRFTYVVDSNQALLNWANNVSGNDYSAVLIRRGTWTSTKGVNLTTSGTKVVVGEAGSKLVFNGVEKGLYYNTTPTTPDYWMRDVTVECLGSRFAYGMDSCTNLSNCTSTGACPGTAYGFYNCTNLTNCFGIGNGAITGTGVGFGVGFMVCINLTNCTGTATGKGTRCYGFGSCTNITNCTGTATGTGSASTGYGFYNCTNITNCAGTGTGSASGYGFSGCKRVSGCKKSNQCTTSVFNFSYASFSETSAYACADTPEGGFNATTN